MELSGFTNANLDVQKLASLKLFDDVVLPAPDSDVMKKVTFMDRLYSGEITRMNKSFFPSDMNFEFDSPIKCDVLFAEMLRIASERGMSAKVLRGNWGFDSKMNPGTAYMYRAIYVMDKNSPLLSLVPITKKDAKIDVYEFEKMKLALKNIRENKKVVSKVDLSEEVRAHVKELENIIFAYNYIFYTQKKLQDDTKQLVLLSKTNPIVKSLLSQGDIKMINSIEENFKPVQPKQEMLLESELPPHRTVFEKTATELKLEKQKVAEEIAQNQTKKSEIQEKLKQKKYQQRIMKS